MRIALVLLLAVFVVVQANFLRTISLHTERIERAARQVKQEDAIGCSALACTAGLNQTCDELNGVLCQPGFICDLNSQTCVTDPNPNKQRGQTCDPNANTDECDFLNYLQCVAVNSTNFECQVAYIYGPGETCTHTYQCVKGLLCTSGRCVGKTAGQDCDDDNQCVSGHHCNSLTNVCEADVAFGADCDLRVGSPCGLYGYCSVQTEGNFIGRCALPWGKTAGQVCIGNADCDWGLDLYCHYANSTSEFGTCARRPSNSLTNCSDDIECTAEAHQCACNYDLGYGQCRFAGSPANSTWKAVYLSFYSCGRTHNCTSESMDPGSCNAVNCGNEVACFTQLAFDYVIESKLVPAGCFSFPDYGQCNAPGSTTGSGGATTRPSSSGGPTTGSTTNSASSVAFSALMMVALVAAAML